MIASEESGITGISEGQEEIEKIKNGEKKEKKKEKRLFSHQKGLLFIQFDWKKKRKDTVKEYTHAPTFERDIS